ncbi:hypothetical protein A2U01_0057807 [Trifolium medium]|uniref:Uncharacterized protein n=1 Tax=Trifolium medium TaxID=97028 RepID=A0A392RKL0_9FABA|nr:hypothetical protein [Trifolium medium]
MVEGRLRKYFEDFVHKIPDTDYLATDGCFLSGGKRSIKDGICSAMVA